MKKIHNIILFPNGALAVFDKNGQQMAKYQSNLLCDKLRKWYKKGLLNGEEMIETSQAITPVKTWISIGDKNG